MLPLRIEPQQDKIFGLLSKPFLLLYRKPGLLDRKSILSFGQVALRFCLPWASLSVLFFYLVVRRLALVHWASENEDLLAEQENLLISDD